MLIITTSCAATHDDNNDAVMIPAQRIEPPHRADESQDAAAVVPRILFVSAVAGSDLNDGHSPQTPRRTIASTLALAMTQHFDDVRVCEGTYVEADLTITTALVLTSYDCATWTRTATYGYPTFDGAHESVVLSKVSQAASHNDTLIIRGSAVTRAALVDGFRFEGALANPVWGGAARIDDHATPTLSNNRFVGGEGPLGAAGLIINGFASPDVGKNRIVAGHSTLGGAGEDNEPSNPAIGLAQGVEFGGSVIGGGGGSAFIHHNVIDGLDAPVGSSSPTSRDRASIAVLLGDGEPMTEASGNPFAHNIIEGGFSARRVSGVHVFAHELEIDIVDNDIRGSSARPSDPNPETRSQALTLSPPDDPSPNTVRVRVLRNRIFGGAADVTVALAATGLTDAVIANNMIYGGSGSSSVVSLSLGHATRPLVAYNTIDHGIDAGYVAEGRFVNNLLLLGVRFIGAWPDLTFSNNAFVGGVGATLVSLLPQDGDATSYTTIAALESALDIASGNVTTATSQGSPPPCSIARGGTSLAPLITTDIAGASRSSTTPSIGAQELGMCGN